MIQVNKKLSDAVQAFYDKLVLMGLLQDYEKMVQTAKDSGKAGTVAHRKARTYFIKEHPILGGEDTSMPDWCTLRKKHSPMWIMWKERKADKNTSNLTFAEIADWALEFCACLDIMPTDAPNHQAWMLLRDMRGSESFRCQVQGKRIPNLTKANQDGETNDDGREKFDLIAKLEAEASESSQDSVLPLSA